MKRLLCVLLILCAVPVFVFAEDIDLSALSFDELRTLQTRISNELTTRPEWKNVTVPEGFYTIGVDIPAGKWEIRCGEKSEYGYVSINYGNSVNSSGASLTFPYDWIGLLYRDGEEYKMEKVVLDLKEGYYIEIQYGQAVFTIPEKVDLGF